MTNTTTNSTNLFEVATREKYRFNFKGMITVEDLWDLKFLELDVIFKDLNSQLAEVSSVSLFNNNSTKGSEELENKIAIIKHIAHVKTVEQKLKENQIAIMQEEKKILEILHAKEQEELQNLSKEELMDMIKNLKK